MDGGDVKEKKNNRFLVVVLVILCVLIVGLVVGIFVVKANFWQNSGQQVDNANDAQQVVDSQEYVDEKNIYLENIYNEAVEILRSNELNKFEEFTKYFDEQETKFSGDDLYKITILKINILVEYGYYDEAISHLGMLNESELSNLQLYNVYSIYREIYDKLGDIDKRAEYEEKLHNLDSILNLEIFDNEK